MSFLTKPSTTPLLLAINALLLLILVLQQAGRKPERPRPPMESMHPPMMQGHPPMGETGGGSMPMDGNFDPTLMILAAMKCPDDPTLTLDSQACDGKKAEDRRGTVHKLFEKEQSIRGVFDGIVKRYGEAALTDQALQIRKSRRTQ